MSPKNFPAAVAYLVNLVVGTLVAFNFLSDSTAHAVATVAAAVTALVVVFTVRPLILSAAAGAFQTFVVALAAFGFQLTDHQLAAVVAIFTFAATVVTHVLGTPVAAARQGTTAYQLEGLSK
jgi:hypothetical protein